MKKLFVLLFAIFVGCNFSNSKSEEKKNTTEMEAKKIEKPSVYYLIRHAEKDRSASSGKDPELTEEGIKRAEKWATIFKKVNFDGIYSTNYKRTMATAKPTAEEKGLEIISYDANKTYDAEFQKNTKGKTVLVVGHSNTIPAFVNAITGANYKDIPDSESGALFIVTVYPDGKTDTQELYFN